MRLNNVRSDVGCVFPKDTRLGWILGNSNCALARQADKKAEALVNMAVLVEGQHYGLSSKGQLHDNKTRIFVKLTDSALKAIEEYLNIKASSSRHPSIQFLQSHGVLTVPSTRTSNGEHSFNFSLSSTADIEGPLGRYECVQQCGSRSLESLGSMQFKMHIHAKDDVYEATKHRMAVAEEESKKNCTKVIKASGPYVGRKVKVKKTNIVIPPKPSSPPYVKHSSSIGGKPNGLNGHIDIHPNGFHSQFNKVTPSIKSGNPEIMKKSYRERIIHLLAIRPYKKPELLARLMKDGIKEKDRKSLSSILTQVATMKDNTYTLAKHAWSEIQEEWPFYSDSDRQLLKRRLAQNVTPLCGGGDSPSNSQPSSSPTALQSLPQKRASPEPDRVPAKKQRISHFNNGNKPDVHNGQVSSSKPDFSSSKPDFNGYKSDSVATNGHHKNSDTHSSVSHGNSRFETNGYHSHNKGETNGYHSQSKGEANGYSQMNGFGRHEANAYSDNHHSHKSESNGLNSSNCHNSNSNHAGQLHNSSSNRHVNGMSYVNGLSNMTLSPDSQESTDCEGLLNGSSNGSCFSNDATFSDYEEKYIEITNPEQRAQYKADFNSEYDEYRDLHAVVDRVSKRFSTLKESLRNVEEGSEEWLRIKDQVVREYKEMKRDNKYQDAKRRFHYMHEKLAHIKGLVIKYDKKYGLDS